MMKKSLSLLFLLLAFSAAAQPKLSPDNIDEILQAMTQEEKVTLLVGGSAEAGRIGAAGGTRAIPRLGIPETVFSDGPAGVRFDRFATGFPVGTLIASSWDTRMVREMTAAMGEEVLEYGIDVLLAPGMNIHRNPLCGRNFEYFSEDPLLSGKMAAAYVRGLQSKGVGASVKHFAANNQETNRSENDALVSKRALRELYLKNFEIAIRESDPWTVMSSYNKLNGEYTQQNTDLLTTVLRDEWGYKGIVITDWGMKENTVKSAKAGNDLMDPGAQEEYDRLLAAVRDGRISREELDRNVRRILQYIVKTPHFKGYAKSDRPDMEAHARIAREAAAESIVLLKNDRRTLPLSGTERVALYGVASHEFIAGGTGSGEVKRPYVVNMEEALESAGFTLDKRLTQFYAAQVDYQKALRNLEYAEDWGAVSAELPLTGTSIDFQASLNDVAVFVLGRQAGEGKDRHLEADFELSGVERELLTELNKAYHSRGKRVIVVLNIGGVIETASWKHLADAIVLPWSPGQEGANAVADVLTGKVNPSGKLPMTFPNLYFDIPSSADFPYAYDVFNPGPEKDNVDYTSYTEDIWVGYRYFQTAGMDVSYPFGYGLSYTVFTYSKPVVKAGADGFTASVTVTNTGSVAGKEVVQLYVAAPEGGLRKPARELKAFGKTRLLAPGESQVLNFAVSAYELASFNEAVSAWETAAGTYEVLFGASVADIRAKGIYGQKKALRYPVRDVLEVKSEHVLHAPADAAPAGPGLAYTYAEGPFMGVKDLLAAPVKSSGITPVLTTTLKETDDHFGLVFKGLLKIDQSGLYRFTLNCDDGAILWLDGEKLLDLDRDGGGRMETWVKLDNGYHRLEVQYWDNFMEESVAVGLKGPGISVENLPAEILYHE